MPSFALPPPGKRRQGQLDPVLISVITGVLALAFVLTRPVEQADGSPASSAPADGMAAQATAEATRTASTPDQWERGVTFDLRLRPAPTATPSPERLTLVATTGTANALLPQSAQASGGANSAGSTVTAFGPKVPAAVRRFEASVLKWSAVRRVDPNLIAALIMTESDGNPNAVSPKGAIGLMQVMGGPFDPDENIRMGTAEFARHLAKYTQIELALAAYNAGPGAVDRYGGVPPYQETRDHIFRVMLRYRLYTAP